jgi:ribA/ribD-fused uncharacterized protein
MESIKEFRGRKYFLSNFYSRDNLMVYNGITYNSSEAAFQAQKTPDKELQLMASKMKPLDVKKAFGPTGLPGFPHFQLRSDWESVKFDIMLDVLRAKFLQNRDLAEKLLSTGDAELIEGNNWHDNLWGNCTCPKCINKAGRNCLGLALMQVRSELRARGL